MIKPKWIKTDSENFPKGEWFVEYFTKGEFHAHQIKKYIESYKTEFQTATLVETYSFGKVLIIDRETQSSELDEFIYHEALVLPSVLLHKDPKTFAILGGGEGATLREILSYKNAKHAVMVDIDHNIIKFAKKYLESWHKGSFEDKRSTLLIQDARKFIEKTKLKFDVIYSDLPSPIEGGPAYKLYTMEFYKILKTKLNKDGMFAMQAGPGHMLQLELHPALYHTLSKVFKYVASYAFFIPSYDMPWSYIIASDYDIFKVSENEIREKLEKRFSKKNRLIDLNVMKNLFNIPLYMKREIEKNKKIITEKKPVFFSTSRY
ncbi:MAG: fused MFS/spermidine synthase [Elusimicrobiales bacterium]|nr:fused MFS/spermidine synthase [Elusimicrobiales bacterium]